MGESGLNHYFFVAFLLILYTLKTLQNKIDLITIEFVAGSKILEIVAQTFLIWICFEGAFIYDETQLK